MTDTQIDVINCRNVLHAILSNVSVCCNKKRKTKNAEYYLRCGGGYDTESTTILRCDDRPLYAFVYHIQISINGTYLYFRDINLLVFFLRSLAAEIKTHWTDKERPHLILWVANLGHEWAFFKMQLAEVGISDLFAKTERDPLKIEVAECIDFRECIGLFGHSLADIASKYTKTQKLKGDLDYKLARVPNATPLTPEEYQYCKNDVVILDELSHVAFKMYVDTGYNMPLTKTSVLRQRCKKAIKNIVWQYKLNEPLMPATADVYLLFRQYMYNGGLSGSNAFYCGKELHGVTCADITSDYPAQMVHNMFPGGELVECVPSPENIALCRDKFRIYEMTLHAIKTKTTHATLSKHKIINPDTAYNLIINNGKITYGKNIRVCFNNIDFAAFCKIYDIIGQPVVHRFWYFTKKCKAPKFLLDTMLSDYKKKNALKRAGKSDTIEYIEAKQAVNSYYGMACTRLYDEMYTYNAMLGDIAPNKDNIKPYNEMRQHIWLSPYIGYWTTSYARALLIHFIAKYPDLIVQYDTDSLYYMTDTSIVDADRVKAFEAELESYNARKRAVNNGMFKGDIDYLTLGTWDIDPPTKRFKCLGAKRYIKETADGKIKPVVAGMVKSAFVEYVSKNNLDPFALFCNNMTLDNVVSKKLGSAYHDRLQRVYDDDRNLIGVVDVGCKPVRVTDYLGNTEIVEIGTYHALYPICFTMFIGKTFSELYHAMQIERAYPQDDRLITKIIRETLGDVI